MSRRHLKLSHKPKYPVRPRVRPATEAGLRRSTEAAKAYMRQLLGTLEKLLQAGAGTMDNARVENAETK
jgi:hypothetical protein